MKIIYGLLIIALIAIGVAIFVHVYKKQNIPLNPNNSLTTNMNATASDPQTQAVEFYAKVKNDFKIKLPAGIHLSKPADISNGISLYQETIKGYTPSSMLGFFQNLQIETTSCGTGETVTINGIPFIVSRSEGDYGGMESGSIDTYYCTEHSGYAYTISFSEQYPRGTGTTTPDMKSAYADFSKEMQSLNFGFTP